MYVSFNEFFDYLYENWQKKNPVHLVYSFLNKIDYYRTISYYSHEFGVENIHVLLYEDFKNNPIKFYTKLCNVMDISFDAEAEYIKMNKIVNPGTNNLQLKYFAIKSKILGNISLARSVPGGKLLAKYLYNNMEHVGTGHKLELTNEQVSIIKNIFKDGNQTISNELSLQLDQYGYYT